MTCNDYENRLLYYQGFSYFFLSLSLLPIDTTGSLLALVREGLMSEYEWEQHVYLDVAGRRM